MQYASRYPCSFVAVRHCQDLERENARFQAGQTQSPSKKLKASESEPSQDVLAELAHLREANAQLAAQNAELSAQNAHLTTENARLSHLDVQPKLEDDDCSTLLTEPSSRREKESKEKHGTGSVALMVRFPNFTQPAPRGQFSTFC
jgi:hypothetical protein